MEITEKQQNLLKQIPGVDKILVLCQENDFFDQVPKGVLVKSIRLVVENLRKEILSTNDSYNKQNSHNIKQVDLSNRGIIEKVKQEIDKKMSFNLKQVINGTGVVVHTNLGRSLLAQEVIENIDSIACKYSNLEFDLNVGKRGLRYTSVEDIICEISGAESAMVVNNNAGAVLLALDTVAKEKEVIVSRGELVEIGGSFRIPDVMEKSGGILKEVGTTNRTHLKDYENAITQQTGLLLKVHTSNYSIIGFTASISLREMVELGKKHDIPVMEDLGSGTFIDFSKYGLMKEPTVSESVAAGIDIITFSGDKLLGGPQAGIIIGKKRFIDKIKQNPLTRALRIDKMTLAALESTMHIYRDEKKAIQTIPTLRMLTMSVKKIESKAYCLINMLKAINNTNLIVKLVDIVSKAGGGALPLLNLSSKGIGIKIKGMSTSALEKHMRYNSPPIIGRIEDDLFMLDLRTVNKDELEIIKNAIITTLENI